MNHCLNSFNPTVCSSGPFIDESSCFPEPIRRRIRSDADDEWSLTIQISVAFTWIRQIFLFRCRHVRPFTNQLHRADANPFTKSSPPSSSPSLHSRSCKGAGHSDLLIVPQTCRLFPPSSLCQLQRRPFTPVTVSPTCPLFWNSFTKKLSPESP